MPPAEFFERLGFLTVRGFLDEDALRRVRTTMLTASGSPAETVHSGEAPKYEPETRSTRLVDVDQATRAQLDEMLAEIRPRVAERFGTELERTYGLQFLHYTEGDYFKPHKDNTADDADARRELTALIFVNAPGPDGDGDYEGGELTFYGLLEASPEAGMVLDAEPGLLVVFPSATWHGVSTVTRGDRLTIAAWYL